MSEDGLRIMGCLFCGNAAGKFTAEEHIVPLTLGNTLKSGLIEQELVIPPGEVCDKCNGRRLGQRDQALANWGPVSAFRTLSQIRNRRGSLVDAAAGTEWDFRQDQKDARNFELHVTADTGPGSGRDQVARALCKIALETRWLEDPEDARSARWDEVAAAALGGPLPTSTAIGLVLPPSPAEIDLTPRCEIRVHPGRSSLRLCSLLSLVGIDLVLVIETGVMPIPGSVWWRLDRASGSLVGPDSIWLDFKGTAASFRSVAPATSDPPPRRRSELPTGDPTARILLQSSGG